MLAGPTALVVDAADAVTDGDGDDGARDRTALWRGVAATALVAALVTGIVLQRATITGALGQISRLSAVALIGLLALTVYERWARADIVRSLLGDDVSLRSAVTIHDVGTAVSKGVPFGGALGTAVRWSIAREGGIRSTRFASMLIAYGIATTFVTWLLPVAALSIDLTQRRVDRTDIAILAVIASVLVGSALFWWGVLRSDRLERWSERRVRALWTRLASRVPSMANHDPAAGVAEVRRQTCAIARRPWSLLARTMVAQACGSMILLLALRSLGVGDELGTTEFFRVFFITHLLGTFAPTPGGVGVVEAGATGALVAAGVDTTSALAGVLVYRFVTYVVPIAFGALLYVLWRGRRVRSGDAPHAKLVAHGTSVDPSVPDVPRPAGEGLRRRRHPVRDDGAAA
ncbi:lysylphosphatidylglycerol synthase transmembrane domain-containing protein [Ilumatobacter sp.]|uniref:lysylphosphatidylglycerol synthase transmembrane domain-containing protein n=1 Tax=Ilumatobacter sp. TaxID=1967498 RepID=UPI003B51951E